MQFFTTAPQGASVHKNKVVQAAADKAAGVDTSVYGLSVYCVFPLEAGYWSRHPLGVESNATKCTAATGRILTRETATAPSPTSMEGSALNGKKGYSLGDLLQV